jgi:hypothetical protein
MTQLSFLSSEMAPFPKPLLASVDKASTYQAERMKTEKEEREVPITVISDSGRVGTL